MVRGQVPSLSDEEIDRLLTPTAYGMGEGVEFGPLCIMKVGEVRDEKGRVIDAKYALVDKQTKGDIGRRFRVSEYRSERKAALRRFLASTYQKYRESGISNGLNS